MTHYSKKFYRRSLTIMEILVVIVIIGLVSSVIAYNVKGSLDKSRAFTTEQALLRLDEIIALEVPVDHIDRLISDPKTVLSNTHLAKNADKLLKDGWGEPFKFTREKGGQGVKIEAKNRPKLKRVVALATPETTLSPKSKCPALRAKNKIQEVAKSVFGSE